jgi:hypothetical protein
VASPLAQRLSAVCSIIWPVGMKVLNSALQPLNAFAGGTGCSCKGQALLRKECLTLRTWFRSQPGGRGVPGRRRRGLRRERVGVCAAAAGQVVEGAAGGAVRGHDAAAARAAAAAGRHAGGAPGTALLCCFVVSNPRRPECTAADGQLRARHCCCSCGSATRAVGYGNGVTVACRRQAACMTSVMHVGVHCLSARKAALLYANGSEAQPTARA